jgi:hypothetical protein
MLCCRAFSSAGHRRRRRCDLAFSAISSYEPRVSSSARTFGGTPRHSRRAREVVAWFSNARLAYPSRGCPAAIGTSLYGRNYDSRPTRYDRPLVTALLQAPPLLKTYRPAAPPIRPEHHVSNSSATIRIRLAPQFACSLHRYPCCLRYGSPTRLHDTVRLVRPPRSLQSP